MRDEQTGAVAPFDATPAHPLRANKAVTRRLRILATTDLHMQIVGFDYARDAPLDHGGLASLATLIHRARQEAADMGMACILIDNGDMLQGTALGHTMLETATSPDHPLAVCLNALEYDCFGLGNHDLDFGLDYVAGIAAQLNAPVISSNLDLNRPGPILPSALISRSDAEMQIGLISVLPEKTADWNARELEGRGTVRPIAQSVEKAAQDIRARGADVVILLAHLGVKHTACGAAPDDDARSVAGIKGIDAIVLGHTHRRLPGRDHVGFESVDTDRGTLGARPSAMAGFEGSDLAVIDLTLTQEQAPLWEVSDHQATLRRNTAEVPRDPSITALCAPAHAATRAALSAPCGRLEQRVHNYFSLAAPTLTCALVANARCHAIQPGLAGLTEARLPILATASAHTAGGWGGPANFLDVAPGEVRARHLSGLSPYSDGIWAVHATGKDMLRWLETSASVYTRLSPSAKDQTLLLDSRPAFDFDTIYGLNYRIDPTQPIGQRITELSHAGRPVQPDQDFVVATNSFRAVGGGAGQTFDESQILYRSPMPVLEALRGVLDPQARSFPITDRPWQFQVGASICACLSTAPEALAHLDHVAHLRPRYLGKDDAGFARLSLTL